MRDLGVARLATKEHVAYCFDTLASHFSSAWVEPNFEDLVCPLFVTWNKSNHRGTLRLRGCIGTLEARALRKALKDYALMSALNDRRFPAVTVEELAQLHCTVSFLHTFEKTSQWSDWTIGVHGLIINFKDPAARIHRTATFLPEVAAHEGWSQLQTLEALIRKAGYSGSAQTVLQSLEVTRYQSSACSMSYAEYFAIRNGPKDSRLPDGGIAITVPA